MMERREIGDLIISALVLAFAFSMMFSGMRVHRILALFPASLITVSVGFLIHELAHKFTAQRFGCLAEYQMWPHGLMLAILFSFFGFVFAAPGAVMIRPRVDPWGFRVGLSRREIGLISLAGPLSNIILASAFLLLYPTFLAQMFLRGARINAFLALFNLFPIPPLDGAKVFFWSKSVWVGVFLPAIVLSFVL